ncbi:MAG: enoyl-CoA hydratase-related protein [Bdellovibrionota bacterium]|nr:enoyl-CoA hydratase-related protein [Bdellovibrionota bacterium]
MSGSFYLDDFNEDIGVLRVSFNRPEVRNAFNDEMIEELINLFSSIAKREDVRLVLLEGKGKAFSAGADLNWMKKMKDYSSEENKKDSERLAELFKTMNALPQPLVALVKGHTLGGGTGILSVCDFVLAEENSKFGFTEVRLGLVPAVISPFVIAKIGESQARAYFLSGEIFKADVALRMGLIHKVVPGEVFDQECERLVLEFLKAAPKASKEAKELVFRVKSLNSDELTDYTCQTIARIRTGEEGQEGMKALLQKEKAPWIK